MLQYRKAVLSQKVEEATEAGITNVESVQEYGMPGPILCELAQKCNVDVLIVGSHQRTGLAEMLMGSTSNYIMHHAPCSVLVAHQQSA